MSALIAELSGIQAVSRKSVQQFLSSVLGISISTGAIQKMIDRVSDAIEPAYERIGQVAHGDSSAISTRPAGLRPANCTGYGCDGSASIALYLVHPRRSREAFNELIRQWHGILASDNYSVYLQKLGNQR